MNQQLDQLEMSVLTLIEAFGNLKQENAQLKADLEAKNAELTAMQAQTQDVRERIDQLIASLQAEQN